MNFDMTSIVSFILAQDGPPPSGGAGQLMMFGLMFVMMYFKIHLLK